ncbi:MAG: energy transducer TonB [Gemmatimonadota bacterium]
MKRYWLVLVLLIAAVCDRSAEPPGRRIGKAPTLQNREAILRERQELANRLLAPGDSITINVYLLVDKQGLPHQPEVKQQLDARLANAAMALVLRMRFNPATIDGTPQDVLLTVPVRFIAEER